MNRKTIEQAADNYAAKATPSYTNGDFDRNAIAEAFECGANWRINSVWHDNTILPDRNLNKECYSQGEDILMKPKELNAYILCDVMWDDDEHVVFMCNDRGTYVMEDVEVWAYISDLLPERKEETK